MTKRGKSGLSFIIGINKPTGISSHDVVNRCRTVFDERRVGHAGTLDPLAQGVLPVCIGPATRLNEYLLGQDKEYEFTVCFGAQTDTDDREGNIIREALVPDELLDPFFAQSFIEHLVGEHEQIPPRYSAIKVDGKRAYKKARAGEEFIMSPRSITIHEARLLGIEAPAEASAYPAWRIVVRVSKGTYIRSLARDIGDALDCPAHVGFLERTRVDGLGLKDCISYEDLSEDSVVFCCDPVKLLGFVTLTIDEPFHKAVENGRSLTLQELYDNESGEAARLAALEDGTLVSLLTDTKALKALYRYDGSSTLLKPERVFSIGVSRGKNF